jgi:hypothetical protein
MKTKYQFTQLDMALFISNAVVFSGGVLLLLLGRASGALVLLTVGVAGMLLGNLSRAYYGARHSESELPGAVKSRRVMRVCTRDRWL